MNKIVSTEKLIREMDSTELLDFLTEIWQNKYNRNTVKFLDEEKKIISTCSEVYHQMTKSYILNDISENFSVN